jgi:hypothetical protein
MYSFSLRDVWQSGRFVPFWLIFGLMIAAASLCAWGMDEASIQHTIVASNVTCQVTGNYTTSDGRIGVFLECNGVKTVIDTAKATRDVLVNRTTVVMCDHLTADDSVDGCKAIVAPKE